MGIRMRIAGVERLEGVGGIETVFVRLWATWRFEVFYRRFSGCRSKRFADKSHTGFMTITGIADEVETR
jgi:hypothetical protein